MIKLLGASIGRWGRQRRPLRIFYPDRSHHAIKQGKGERSDSVRRTQREFSKSADFLKVSGRSLSVIFILLFNSVAAVPPVLSADVRTLNPQADSQQTGTPDLKLGQAIERELKGGEAHSYGVRLEAGQYLHVVVEQKGIDVLVRIVAPDGKQVIELDSPNGSHGPEPVSVIAEAKGEYRVEVRSLDDKAAPGRYELKVEELRESTDRDRNRVAAERLLSEAEGFRAQETGESLRKAIQRYDEALPLLRAAEDKLAEAVTLNRMGTTYWYLGENQKALEQHRQALSLSRALADRKEEANTLHNFGVVYWRLGDSRKALEYYSQALTIFHARGDRLAEHQTLSAMGVAYERLGKPQEAIDYYNRALPLQRATGERWHEGRTLDNIGAAYSSYGDLQKALEYFNQALPLRRAAGDPRGEANTLNNIGILYWKSGDLQKALEYLNQALPLRRSTGDRPGEVSTLHNIGIVQHSLGDSQKALEYYNQALTLARTVGDRWIEAYTLQQIGSVYGSLGDWQKALEYLNQALPLRRAVADPLGEGVTLSQIGVSYSSLGKREEALKYLEQALSLHRAVGDRIHEATTLQEIARVQSDLGRLDEARVQIEAALKIIESTRSSFVSQQLRTSFSASSQDFYQFYIDLLMRLHRSQPSAGHEATALQASEMARARSLLDILTESRADIRQGVDPALLERERNAQRQLSAAAERLSRLLGGKHTEEEEKAARQEVEVLVSEYQEVEAEIRAKSPRYAALTQPQPLTAQEIQQALDKDTILLEYALGEERSYLWMVTQTSVKSFELPKRSVVEAQARRAYDLLVSKTDALYPEALTSLSRTLLGPVADQLGRKRLLIVGEGALQYVPFGALPEPTLRQQPSITGASKASNKYQPLIVEHEVVTLPSASVVVLMRRETYAREAAPKRLAVLADPVFATDDQRVKSSIKSQQADGRDGGEQAVSHISLASDIERSANDLSIDNFDRLPVSRREAELITALLPKGQSFKALDFDASRAAATSPELGRYQIVHFATHSLLNNQHPELSGIVLSLVDAKGQPQNGFLRLHEIYNLKLEADLVVLSSCQTALGKEIKGEGLVGLTRGFMYAGAPRVVASLWKVSDSATAELMQRFYRNMLGARLRPAAALRSAQVSMWKEKQWAAPYYWSGFVLQGEWR